MNNKNEISNKTDSDSSDSTDSEEASESSSDSSSSSPDDSSKTKKLPQAQQFSVMRSDTAGGLRMKISAVPVSVPSTQSNNNNDSNKDPNISNKNHKLHKKQSADHKQKRHENETSSSWCSECSDSGSDSSSATNNQPTKRTNKSTNFKQMKSSNVRSSSSDSDSSEVDSDNETKFLKSHSTSGNRPTKIDSTITRPNNKTVGVIQTTDAADGASSSDMELPALVNAAIQRVESFSDGENSKNDPIPQYTSTLLRDFMAKTQMMGSSLALASSSIEKKDIRQLDTASNSRAQQINKDIKTESPQLAETVPQKRKRGRPKKQMPLVVNVGPVQSESPDSGIISTPHSPVLPIVSTDASMNHQENKSLQNPKKKSPVKKPGTSSTTPRLNIASLEKSIYATERVLYPPRRKKRDTSASSTKAPLPEDLLDPVWRKIDINKKFRRPSVSGYKSDGGCSTVCSKVLAARCNNVTDYGSVSQRSLSGYKSDYSCKSKRSGYKSDYSVAKSCGYRTDSGMKNRKRVRKKRRLKSLCSKSPVNDLDILQLAGLSLGQSEESSRDSLNKSSGNLMAKSNFRRKSKNSMLDRDTNSNTSKDILSSLCERVTKRLSGLDDVEPSTSPVNSSKLGGSTTKSSSSKSGMITCRRMSTVSHCSSRSGASRMHSRRKHRKRLKSRSRSDNFDSNSVKLNMQIDMLTNFMTLCHINDKTSKADNATKSKRLVKKRKQSVNSDVTNSSAATTSKRRHKKTPQTQSPDDHKLPLKKRLYLLTPGEKLDGKLNTGDSESVTSTTTAHKASTNANAKISTKAITPKKRHLLENQHAAVSCIPKSLNSPKQVDSNTESNTPIPTSVSAKNSHQTRKRSKPELSAASKFQSSNRPSVIRSSSTVLPPPGVFESTIDLEVQIPAIPNIVTKTEIDSPRTLGETIAKIVKDEPNSKSERVVESLLNKTGGHLLLKKKRKKANRTGFPTIRKKKKKTLDDWNTLETKPATESMEVETTESIVSEPTNVLSTDDCDRVPKSGETAATFIERNSRPRLSVVSLERLQGKITNDEDSCAIESTNATTAALEKQDKNEDKNDPQQDYSEQSTMVVKERRSDVIGRVKQHLKKNLREPRDASSDNEPLIKLVAPDVTPSELLKVPLKETAAKPTRQSSKVVEVLPTAKRTRRVISLDTLGEDQIKEIERTSKLAIVKLEMLKSDRVLGTKSRPTRHQPDPIVKIPDKPAIFEKPKRTKILTALETLGQSPVVRNPETVKMTRRLTMASVSAECIKRTRQNTGISRLTEISVNDLRSRKSTKTTKTQTNKLVGVKPPSSEIKNATLSKEELSTSKTSPEISTEKAKTDESKSKSNTKVSKAQSSKATDAKIPSIEAKSVVSPKAEPSTSITTSETSVEKTKTAKATAKSNDKSTASPTLALPVTNKRATGKDNELGVKSITANPTKLKETKNNSTEIAPNAESKEVLEKTTKKAALSPEKPQCLTTNLTQKPKKTAPAKKSVKSGTQVSVDSKKNYQSEFEKSIADALPKKLVSKENVDQPLSQSVKSRAKSAEITDGEGINLLSTPSKGRKRRASITPSKHKEVVELEVASKKRKNVETPKNTTQQPNASNTTQVTSKRRYTKVIDKPLIELQPPIVSSTIKEPKSIEKKASTQTPLKKLRKATESQQELPDPSESTDETAHVRPYDPIKDLEHDPLPELVPKIVEPSSDSDSSKKAPKLKKKYLTAGLFSDYFKRSPKSSDKPSTRTKDSIQEDHRVSLPIPHYCEKYFRRTIVNFELPYELWYAHQNEKLPGRNSVPSWNFKKLRTNIYGDVRANPSTDQLAACSCKPETACGDDCLNRLMYTECSPKTCPCADKCQNMKIQRHIVALGVERFMTQNKGWGVRTKQLLKKGTYILEYVGEVVTEREFKERMATLYVRDTHHYCLNLDGGLVIDGHRSGSDARFVNHSCSPNCEIQKWSVNGLFRMALFTMRDIEPNEELTYDYNFSLFNPAEGQPCRCDTPQCRGVIGGKSQRIKPIDLQVRTNTKSSNSKGKTGRPRKNKANKNQSFMHHKDRSHIAFVHPTSKEMLHIKNGNCFLIRNIRKYRQKKIIPSSSTPTTLTAQISALRTPRNIRTRGLTIAEHDPTIEKTARIAGILREVCEELGNYKDKTGQYVVSKLNPPSKKKCPEYYEKIEKPIDLSTIELNVEKGQYKLPSSFDEDVLRLFSNVVKFFGLNSVEGIAAQELLACYTSKKQNVYQRLLTIIGDSQLIKTFVPDKPNQLLLNIDPNEDIIQCICGLFRDEGVMIQCSKCMVWQHTECTGADINAESYLCERCDSRTVDLEIPLNDYTDEGYRYYLTLMRGDLQVHQTDTVYVLRDIPITPEPESTSPVKKHTYKTIGKIEYTECDIFRVERLWKDHDGNRFVFGHHYLRPHETYHEPSRRFYQNEVVRVPLYEVVPIDLVMGRCWVLDPATFCKGRPVDCEEAHVYICELRMDKAARLFSKISKQQYPICTKTYAFNKFEQKLKITRNYLPHHVNNLTAPKPKKKKTEEQATVRKNSVPIVQLMPIPSKTLNEKRNRLENNLVKLMTKVKSLNEGVQPINLSYLLTGRGARRRANVTTNVPL